MSSDSNIPVYPNLHSDGVIHPPGPISTNIEQGFMAKHNLTIILVAIVIVIIIIVLFVHFTRSQKNNTESTTENNTGAIAVDNSELLKLREKLRRKRETPPSSPSLPSPTVETSDDELMDDLIENIADGPVDEHKDQSDKVDDDDEMHELESSDAE